MNRMYTSVNSVTRPFNNSDCAETLPEKMTGEECFARFHQKLKSTENRALRNFNKLDESFKFVVMTLANRTSPGAFRADEVGQPFEYFDIERRRLIIQAMNEITRWGSILPRRFSVHECIISK